MKFQMIIAACLAMSAQLASASAPADCQKNANQNGTGIQSPFETEKTIATTVKHVQTAELPNAAKSVR